MQKYSVEMLAKEKNKGGVYWKRVQKKENTHRNPKNYRNSR
tara:strand:+ start:362 stop:484 length:123 start_codon:yes stop_codon:yes gene_type:complete